MDKIGDFLEGVLKKKMNEKPVESAQVVDRFRDLSVEMLGSDLVRYISSVTFRDGVLQLDVLSSVVAQELQIKKIEILERLNVEEIDKVEDVRFKIGNLSE